jgi:hypothetical protein
MPVYGVAQAGGVLTAVYPGESFKLFDGTETAALNLKSIAFNRAPGNMMSAQQVFTATFPSAPTATVSIQGSNDDVDAHYQTLGQITTQTGNYADYGEFKFYRAQLTVYSAGGMPTVIVQR